MQKCCSSFKKIVKPIFFRGTNRISIKHDPRDWHLQFSQERLEEFTIWYTVNHSRSSLFGLQCSPTQSHIRLRKYFKISYFLFLFFKFQKMKACWCSTQHVQWEGEYNFLTGLKMERIGGVFKRIMKETVFNAPTALVDNHMMPAKLPHPGRI